MSPACSVSVPCETPAFAITRSGGPCFAMKSAAAALRAPRSRTSAVYVSAPDGSD